MKPLKSIFKKYRDYINRPVLKKFKELETINKNLVFLINQSIDITKVKTLPSVAHVQKRQFEVLRKYDEFLRAIDVEYFLIYGSLLGVFRNKSFVPWDDDIDIGIFHEDLYKILGNEQLLKEFGIGLSSPFTEENNFNCPGWHKIFDIETNFHIDLFLFDIVNNKDKNKILKIKREYHEMADKERHQFWLGKMEFEILRNKLKQLNETYFSRLDFRTREKATKDSYILPNITNHYSSEITKFEYVFPIKKTEFSVLNNTDPTLIASIPNKSEKIIIDYYGKDYMFFPNKIFPLHLDNHIE